MMDLLALRANTRFIAWLLRTNLRSVTALRGSFCFEMGFMALNNLVFFTFWWALFLKVPNIRGHQLSDVAVLFGTVAVGYGLFVVFAGGAREIGRLVLEGELDPHLTMPKSALISVCGSRMQASGLGDVVSGFGLVVWFGEIPIGRTPVLLLAAVSSALVFASSVVLFWSLTFWLGRVEALVRQLSEMLISFSLYPERLFGGAFRWLLFTLLPAGFVGYLPSQLVVSPRLGTALALVVVAIGYLALASWVFGLGLRRYASGSRFGVHG